MKKYIAIMGLVVLFPAAVFAAIPTGQYICHIKDVVDGDYTSKLVVARPDATRPDAFDFRWAFENGETTNATGLLVGDNHIAAIYRYDATKEKKIYAGVVEFTYNETTHTLAGSYARLGSRSPRGTESCVLAQDVQ
ncbi:MAG: hypothetical protein V4496_07785 [Pseudomonadota bacterium]